ncbi:MBL fold metallo-hydrolase [uncultured Robinsoniella sp.]|uniref:MBL fold metallo-hydrolase n=1 Tax=uncultured Robinsoniella sp. TaxID=904190 RepID=UPI00290DFF15|nr:MBL fold metallo-hydrolase [Clostridiales bacterium]
MVLKVLGSGSSGNCYILENANEALIIEAGVPFKEVKIALDFNISKIAGVVTSHSHGDHSKYIKEFAKAGMNVFIPSDLLETSAEIGNFAGTLTHQMRIPLRSNFTIIPFEVVHDVECYGFLISHPDMGRLLFCTDTSYIAYRFKNLNHILAEANYSNRIMEAAGQDYVKRNHVLSGHMEIGTACEFLKVNNNTGLRNVVLLHLSANNADPEQFISDVENVVNCPVYVANKGLEINLDLCPF